ncbi:MAG: hypothetical protein FWF83_08555 [Clostridiales bacterium]|nr:hypothetical protein [Clostridiales bacterium]
MARLNHYMAYLRIAVDQADEGRIAGNVFSQRLKEPIRFTDAADMLLQIEDVLDKQDFPRAFQRKRTFGKEVRPSYEKEDLEHGEGYMDQETVDRAEGQAATFAINVITRQNTTWQGYLDWLDGSPRKAYNSVLELLAMITEGIRAEEQARAKGTTGETEEAEDATAENAAAGDTAAEDAPGE